MTSAEAVRDLKRKRDRLNDALIRSRAEAMRHTLRFAKFLSSGPYSQSDLNAMGNPYGFGPTNSRGVPRSPIPHGDAAIINMQSGRFRSSWIGITTAVGFRIQNTDEIARFLVDGTRYMRRRPIDVRVIGFAKSQGYVIYRSNVERALR